MAFIDRVNRDLAEQPEYVPPIAASTVAPKKAPPSETRSIRLGLRYTVLRRDHFRCVNCGRSPATHHGCVLHVDHIHPFSKGGKTVIENLRTLCDDRNLGKGSRIEDGSSAD